jgi:hypothetical protein
VLDYCVYLTFIVGVMLVTLNALVSVGDYVGLLTARDTFLEFLPAGPLRNLLIEVVGIGPILCLFWRYQRNGLQPLRWWELPAYAALFALYAYLWSAATVIAWGRMIIGRGGWAKTKRSAMTAAAE